MNLYPKEVVVTIVSRGRTLAICKDGLLLANYEMIVRANWCNEVEFAETCCMSFAEAGKKLPELGNKEI